MNISEFTQKTMKTEENKENKQIKSDIESSYHTYPADFDLFDDVFYYVSFRKTSRGISWQLFRRQYTISKEEYLKNCKEFNLVPFAAINVLTLGSVEGHPWNLGEGILLDTTYPNVVSLHTKKFLCFMVDALNEKALREIKN